MAVTFRSVRDALLIRTVDLSTARPKWRLDGPALSGHLLYLLVSHAYVPLLVMQQVKFRFNRLTSPDKFLCFCISIQPDRTPSTVCDSVSLQNSSVFNLNDVSHPIYVYLECNISYTAHYQPMLQTKIDKLL